MKCRTAGIRLAGLACVLAAVASAGANAAAPVAYELSVQLDPLRGALRVEGTATVPPGSAAELALEARHRVEAMTVDGRALAGRVSEGRRIWRLPAEAGAARRVAFRYRGEIEGLGRGADHRAVLGLSRPMADAEGTWLPAGSGWYPQVDGALVTWRMRVAVPAGQRAVAAGRIVREEGTAGGHAAEFDQAAPVPGIDLFAGPYAVSERVLEPARGRRIAVRTWFHAELAASAEDYLAAASEHLLRYEREIGPYPYAGYAIVSSPLPTGFGMPGVAWLGRAVLRLPFIRATSLRHEVLHNWWGNGVYVDHARGNWSEGLTTFMADYARRESEGADAARAMRLGWLRDYAAVAPELDLPIVRFVARRHGAQQAVGYNKAAFVFFMLRDLVGEPAFGEALRRFYAAQRFRTADWDALRRAFEAGGAHAALAPWFAQWLERAGAPAIGVERARRVNDGTGLELILRQSEPVYRLAVPVRVIMADGPPLQTRVDMTSATARVVLALPGKATGVSIDPDVRVFRHLAPDENVPILRDVLIAPGARHVAVGAGTGAAVERLARAVLDHPAGAVDASGPLPASAVLVAGLHADVARWLRRNGLPEPSAPPAGRPEARAWAARSAGGTAVMVVSAPDLAALEALARPLPHLGAQSWAVFSGGRSIDRGLWPARPPVHPVEP